MQVFAGYRFLDAEQLTLASAVVDQHLALAVHPTQRVVVLPLDAILADHVALLVLGELGGVQFRLADFTDVADDLRRQAILGIEPLLRLDQLHLREGFRVAVRVDEGQVGPRAGCP